MERFGIIRVFGVVGNTWELEGQGTDTRYLQLYTLYPSPTALNKAPACRIPGCRGLVNESSEFLSIWSPICSTALISADSMADTVLGDFVAFVFYYSETPLPVASDIQVHFVLWSDHLRQYHLTNCLFLSFLCDTPLAFHLSPHQRRVSPTNLLSCIFNTG